MSRRWVIETTHWELMLTGTPGEFRQQRVIPI